MKRNKIFGPIKDTKQNEVVEEALTVESELFWRNFFSRFNNKIYPMFKEQGLTKSEAMLVWSLAGVQDRICELQDIVEDRWNPNTDSEER